MRWLSIFLIVLPLEAANHYIRQGAGGTADGSDWNNAFTSVPASLTRGDTYYVAGGSYGTKTWNTAVSGTTLITIKHPTLADHGTATGWSDSYTNVAVWDQMFFSSSYWTFDGQTGGGPSGWTNGFGFKVAIPASFGADETITIVGGVSNITIRHTEIRGNKNMTGGGSIANDAFDMGLGARGNNGNQPAVNITISYVYIDDIGRAPFWVRVDTLLVEYSYVGRFQDFPYNPSGSHSELFSFFPSRFATIANNVFTHISGTGGIMFDNQGYAAGNFKVYGNVFHLDGTSNDSNGVIGTWGGGGGEVVKGCNIYNNTFINTPSGILCGFGNVNGTTGIDVRNNLIYASATGINNATHDYNHWVNVSGGTQGEANGSSASGNPFVNYPGLDFSLTVNTTAGQNVGSPYTPDPKGNVRASWTRGAYEYNGSGAAPVITSSLTSTGTNNIAYTYQITADNSPTAFGASPLPTGLSVSGATGLISGTPNVASPPTTNNVTITATNAFGFDSKTLVLIINAQQATIGVIATNSLFEVYTNGTKDYVFVVTNTAGAGTLTGVASTAFPWSIVGNANYSLTTGNTTNITVRYAPTSVKVDSNAVAFTGGGGLTNILTGWAYPVFTTPTFASSNGLVFAPFTTNAGYILQTTTTFAPSEGGRAAYGFKTSGAGTLTISGTVDAEAANSNSFFIQIDSEPTDPLCIWDITSLATNFVSRVVGWRGSGTDVAPQFPTNTWSVPDANVHELIIRGRENNAALKDITLIFVPNTPSAVPPGVPLTFMTTATNDASLTFSWLPPASDGGAAIGGYKIYRGLSAGSETLYTNLAVVTTWTNNGLANGTTYYYTISATNSVGEGGQSSEVIGTPSKLPSAPLNLRVTPGYTKLYLNWDAVANDGGSAVVGYLIYRGTSAGNEAYYDGLVYSPAYLDSSVVNGTTYYYKVDAVNINGEGPLSSEASGVPLNILASVVLQGPVTLQGPVRLQ